MDSPLVLRLATLADGPMLLEWRNDQTTREASHSTGLIAHEEHTSWLKQTLENPRRTLFVAEQKGCPVGTVRADSDGTETELSWTVAPQARGMGVAKRMLRLAVARINGPLRAEVKKDNEASLRLAAAIGLIVQGECSGVVYFRSPAAASCDADS